MEYMGEEYEQKTSAGPIAEVNAVFSKVFLWMFGGLFLTGIIAYVTYSSGLVYTLYYSSLYIVTLIAELILVIATSYSIRKLSATTASVLFLIYSAVNGLNLSIIFAVYELGSIGIILLETSLLFGALAFIGYTTKVDVSKWGTVLLVALFVSIIATIINMFIGSEGFSIALTWITLLIFGGLTIYDTNKIKNLIGSEVEPQKIVIYGALELYLDFINIFLRILSLFGKRRS